MYRLDNQNAPAKEMTTVPTNKRYKKLTVSDYIWFGKRSHADSCIDARSDNDLKVSSRYFDRVVIDRESKCHAQVQRPGVRVEIVRNATCKACANIVSYGYVDTWNIRFASIVCFLVFLFLFFCSWLFYIVNKLSTYSEQCSNRAGYSCRYVQKCVCFSEL